MAIIMITGLPGAGKSLETAKVSLDTLWTNFNVFKKRLSIWKREPNHDQFFDDRTGQFFKPKPRQLWSNIRFSKEIESIYTVADRDDNGFIRYWTDPAQLVKLRDCDVVWDEMATHLDATQWANMSLELKRWLQQHRKFGIDIYGNAQDFQQVDKSARRLCAVLYHMSKVIGSRDISATRPPVKRPWGIIMVRTIDPQTYDDAKTPSQQKSSGLSTFRFIRKDFVNAFDTRQEIAMGKYPPLRHIARDCELDNCSIHKVIHI